MCLMERQTGESQTGKRSNETRDCKWIHIERYVFVCICFGAFVFACACACLCWVGVCVFMCVWLCMCASMCELVYACGYVWVFACAFVVVVVGGTV